MSFSGHMGKHSVVSIQWKTTHYLKEQTVETCTSLDRDLKGIVLSGGGGGASIKRFHLHDILGKAKLGIDQWLKSAGSWWVQGLTAEG